MLARVKKTPGKLDDFVVILLGFAIFGPLLLRLLGWIDVSFQYFEVGAALVAAGFAIFHWLAATYSWLRQREAGFQAPQPMITLLLAFAIYHFLDIYSVEAGAVIYENSLEDNLWFLLVTYATSAVLLGRYLWILDFFAFLAWMMSGLMPLRRRGLGAGTDSSQTKETASVDTGPAPVNDYEIRDASAPEPDDSFDLPDISVEREETRPNPVIQNRSESLSETFSQFDAPESSLPPPEELPGVNRLTERGHEDLIQGAVSGNTEDLIELIARLRDTADQIGREQLAQVLSLGMPPFVVEKTMAGIFEDSDKLQQVLQHPGFSNNPRQKQALIEALEAGES